VKYGLNKINSGGRPAVNKLKEAISLPWITSENISFGIAPHINAAGRMASAREAVELFRADNDIVIEDKVKDLVFYNQQRKKKQDEAYNEAVKLISGEEKFIVLNMESIHEGIGGIVAGKIKEGYDRPVIIVTPSEEGFLKGTGRSIEKIDIYKLLKKHEELFERFGGHKSACGFLMREENLSTLRNVLDEEVAMMLNEDPGLFDSTDIWDIEIEPDEITIDLARMLRKMEPVGQGNPKPKFLIKSCKASQIRFMGAEETHVRFIACSNTGAKTECVLFKKAQEMKDILCGALPFDITGTIELQYWNGREKVQFIVEEIKECI